MTPVTHTQVSSGLTEASSFVLQRPPCLTSLPAEELDSDSGLEERHTASAPPCHSDKVFIPDMFVSFVSQKPRSNPYYDIVKLKSEEWMKQICEWTEKEHEKCVRADFPYFVALWSPDAELEEYRTVCDWAIWVFEFDDPLLESEFDDEINCNPELARKEVEALTKLMKSPNPVGYSAAYHPLRYVYQSVWQRISKRSPPGVQRRFIKAMEGYFSGVVRQEDLRSLVERQDIEEYIAVRRESVGVMPCLALIEFAHALDIPDEVFEHHSIRTIETLATDLVLLQNDILSFHREQSNGFNTNIVYLFRQEGLSQQQAYDEVNLLLHKRYRAWYVAHSEIPVWGEEIDAQVMLYVKGCLDIVLANVNWSFKSERYFGTDNAAVRKMRMVSVLP